MDLALLHYLRGYLTERRKELFQEVLSERTRHFTVVTEDVYQLHNTSAVIRSCDIFGIQDLYVIQEKYGKRLDEEIAMGAQKWINVKRKDSVETCVQTLKDDGYQIVATTPHRHSVLLHEFDISKKSAFFFGTEKSGLSPKVMESADAFLKIPMYGFTESLNVSVSAAIIIQSLVSRLKLSEINWKLSEREKVELEIEWSKRSIRSSDKIIERFRQEQLLNQ